MLGHSEFEGWIRGIIYFTLVMNLEEEYLALLHTVSGIKH